MCGYGGDCADLHRGGCSVVAASGSVYETSTRTVGGSGGSWLDRGGCGRSLCGGSRCCRLGGGSGGDDARYISVDGQCSWYVLRSAVHTVKG
jgi:hypothetical protein